MLIVGRVDRGIAQKIAKVAKTEGMVGGFGADATRAGNGEFKNLHETLKTL